MASYCKLLQGILEASVQAYVIYYTLCSLEAIIGQQSNVLALMPSRRFLVLTLPEGLTINISILYGFTFSH